MEPSFLDLRGLRDPSPDLFSALCGTVRLRSGAGLKTEVVPLKFRGAQGSLGAASLGNSR